MGGDGGHWLYIAHRLPGLGTGFSALAGLRGGSSRVLCAPFAAATDLAVAHAW
jgi:hypothetical protein